MHPYNEGHFSKKRKKKQEVHRQPRSWTGGDCCPDIGEPLPDRRGRRAREEDVRQSGELLLAGARGAQVGGCTAPMDVALEGAHKELAMKEAPSYDPGALSKSELLMTCHTELHAGRG